MWLKGDDGKIGELIAWNLQVEHDYALVKLSDGRFESWLTGSIVEVPAPQTSEDEVSPNSAEPKPVTGSLPCGEHNTASPKLLSELKVIDCLIQCGGVKSLEQAHDRLYAVITQLQA